MHYYRFVHAWSTSGPGSHRALARSCVGFRIWKHHAARLLGHTTSRMLAMESLDVSYAGVAGVGWNDAISAPVGCCGDHYYSTGTLPPSTNNYLCGQCIVGEIIARAEHGRRTLKALYLCCRERKTGLFMGACSIGHGCGSILLARSLPLQGRRQG